MADDHADGAIVHGINGIHIESRWLENSGGEYDFVQQRIVISVGGRRRHAPASAVDGLADLQAVVFFHEFSSSDHVFEKCVPANLNVAVILPLVRISDLGIEG